MNRYFRFYRMDIEAREAMLDRMERLTELPLLLLSFIMIPLLLGPMLWELSATEDVVFSTLDKFIWALFAADLVIKLAVAPDRLRFVKRNWLEVLVVAVPFIRPLRLVRLFVFGTRAFVRSRRLVNVDFLLVYAIGMVAIAATIVTTVEAGHDTIESFPDALWWSMVTVTTVGYGDMTPVTPTGRAIAVFLMIGGIGLFGGLTANLASAIMKTEDTVEANVDLLLEEVRALRSQVGGLEATAEETARSLQTPTESQGFSLAGAANIIRERLTGAVSRLIPRPTQQVEVESRSEDMPDSQTFRQAWGKFATGVSVVTTVQEDGSVHGMTANGISSVSLDPPLVLVCVGHTAASYPLIREAKRFAINIMNEDQRPLAEYYARPSDQKTGELDVSFTHTERGVATVDGSLAHMDCRVVSEHEAGDHTIFIAEVEEIEIGDGKPLLYYEGRFSSLANGSQD